MSELFEPAPEREAVARPENKEEPCRPLSARIREIWANMPDEDRAEYPEGGARRIDHHVYGLPNR